MSSLTPSSPATSAAMAGSLMKSSRYTPGVDDQAEPVAVELRCDRGMRRGLDREADRARGPDCPAGTVPTPSIRTRVASPAAQLVAGWSSSACGRVGLGHRGASESGRSSNVYSAAPTVWPEPLMPKTALSPDWIRLPGCDP